MKLRNKDDGRVREFGIDETKSFPYYLRDELGNTYWAKTLKEIADKWEEIEEPKEYWFIDADGTLHCEPRDDRCEFDNNCREIGNYFETKEDAEKAVEKFKAWKRLKDKGFRFSGKEVFSEGLLEIDGVLPALKGVDNAERLKIIDDLDLLFGDEE